ncbi:MAG: hypothetical protein GTN46_04710 [Gammaproteobacteria bacterium]|nr:hypothetical protein [Gammaproteobacteria bacterium]NIO63476.1 hypothetical protein [Gammaproteobacteria bacterium]NIT40841.1 hypothetical protein [Gammaproteobacteria bacterium]
MASARSGNVIGGGDWSEDRLIPDFLRAYDSGRPVVIRSPGSIRPWQHVLEPLSGYLLLAEKLYGGEQSVAGPWNFGPPDQDARSVGWIIQYLVDAIPGATWKSDHENHVHEANCLKLDSSKARELLGWQTRWSLEKALNRVIEWHQQWRSGGNMYDYCREQIAAYCNEAGVT